MKPILYQIPLIKQNLQDCVQTGAAQLLRYYGVKKTLTDIKQEVPVYVTSQGKPLGSSLGHMAAYFITLGFKTTLHIADIEIFDPSWACLTSKDLINKLKFRQPHLRHPLYDRQALEVVFNGYFDFINKGGQVIFPIVSGKYLHQLLLTGPIYAVVSYQGLNRTSKTIFNKAENKFSQDDIQGSPGTHVVIISGYRQGEFQLVDSDLVHYGRRWVTTDHLIAAFYLAQTNLDNLLITLEK
jgi:hypothetical protein